MTRIIKMISKLVFFSAFFLTPVIIFYKLDEIEAKITRPIVYQVDNSGGVMVGRITDKETVDGRRYVTAGAYGRFLVTEQQYNSIEIGDDMPEFLKGRGN